MTLELRRFRMYPKDSYYGIGVWALRFEVESDGSIFFYNAQDEIMAATSTECIAKIVDRTDSLDNDIPCWTEETGVCVVGDIEIKISDSPK